MKKRIIYICTIIILILANCTAYVFADDADEEELLENEVKEISVETIAEEQKEPVLNARAAVIYDRKTKEIIWGKNENEKKAMASTTKIMTAIVVLEKGNLSDVVTISKKAANTGGSRLKINTNDKVSVLDLLYGLMLRSGNDAAVALAEYVGGSIEGFAELMNKKATEIGLKNTHFVTPHGLDNIEHYTTAYELAVLTDYAMQNEKFSKIVNTKNTTISINGVARNIYNTNELLGTLNGVNGVKTGFTNNAGRCLVTSCTRNGNQIITVVLGCDAKKYRTSDSIKLIEYAFKNYTRVNIEEKVKIEFEKWKQINGKRIYISKGEKSDVNLELKEITKKEIPVKIGEENNIQVEINAIYEYEAPLEKQSKIGNILIKKDEEIIESVDIVCLERIEKKNTLTYLKELIVAIFL